MDRGYGTAREKHPKDCASFFSLLTFTYIFKLIRKGNQKDLEENDLTRVMRSMRSEKLGNDIQRCWENDRAKNMNCSVMRAVFSCHGKCLFLLWFAHIAVDVIHTYSVPWSLGKFVSFFEKNQTNITRDEALMYGMILSLISILRGIWKQHYELWKNELGLRMQTSVSSLVYRKALLLTQANLNNITTGNVVTALTKDVQGINYSILFGMDTISELFKIGLIGYLLYQKVELAAVGGMVIILISLLSQFAIATFTYKRRGICNQKSDERLKHTQELLSSIRLIKMYGWESFFEKRVMWLRKIELKNLYLVYILKSLSRIIGSVSEQIAHISTLLMYLWLGNVLNADIVYYTTKLFQKISRTMFVIPMGIQVISECLMAIKRINRILQTEENPTTSKEFIETIKPEIIFSVTDFKIEGSEILKNINLKLRVGLNIIIGPSGCGKSSLLKIILKEYEPTKGKMKVQGRISYAPQAPWLFASSFKQNILFGEKMNQAKYKKVLEICGLVYDLNTIEHGDEAILTDCGANLSKGQQARINLARALYRDSDIYLLDDCLASLDVNIQNHIFQNAIRDYLENKLCVLVTHSTKFAHKADNVIIMNDSGRITYSGDPSDIPNDLIDANDQNTCKNNDNEQKLIISNQCEKDNDDSTEETTSLLDEKHKHLKKSVYKEDKKIGKVDFEVYKRYAQYGGGMYMLSFVCLLHIICEVSSGLKEKFMSKWLNAQGMVPMNETVQEKIVAMDFMNENKSSTYTLSYETTTVYDELSTIFHEIPMNHTMEYRNNMDYFDYFVGFTALSTIFTFLGSFVTFYFAIKISRNIHNTMIAKLLRGCMTFFDTHLIGNILTRCSRDLFTMDEFIPHLWNGLRMIFVLGTSLVLISSINWLFTAISLLLAVVFYLISRVVLNTTRSLQRLSNSSLSPMLGHLNKTLEGLMVIRAHGTQEILREEFDKYQDIFVTAQHLREIASRVMGFYCHMLECIFTTFVTFKLLYLEGILAGDAGLVLTQATMLSHHIEISLLIYMLIETNMTSVERILEYANVAQEKNTGKYLENWPKKGEIKFKDVNLTYTANGETVLKNLNFTIQPKEKIGIIGRTGAGKSSLIVALFKMYDYTGHIMIDDVDINTLNLECVRTHLGIIPQDPVIFSGTVRENIDPFGTIPDEQVWKVLEIVNLKTHFKSLDEEMLECNLSIGQKQLVSIARALTKKSNIIILDEATANMDEKMDSVIHSKIKELFELCTVITIAHRLDTVMHCDRVLVMDKGEVVEFDSPKNLLNDNAGIFFRMISQGGEV